MADKLISNLAKGTWSGATAYTKGDIVDNDGSSYICIANNTNQEPPNATYWVLLASKGDTGATGETGATGAAGADGTDGIDGISFIWEGTWSGATAYSTNDVVMYNGSAYVANTSNTNKTPGVDPEWDLMVQKGDTGAAGADGTDGADGTSFIWEGTWDSGTTYAINDVVIHNGSAYIAVSASTNKTPGVDPEWELFVSKGTDGEGAGDVVGPASSTNNGIPLFDGTDGKLLKDSAKTLPTGAIVGTTDTQTISGKTIDGDNNTISNLAHGAEVDNPSSGVHGVSGNVVGTTDTQTLTNKRITQRVATTTDDATAVIDCDTTDQYELSAIANATEFTITGTPTDGQKLLVRFKDAGVSKALTFTGVTAIGVTLPTATTAGKWGYVLEIYNAAAAAWHALAVGTQA